MILEQLAKLNNSSRNVVFYALVVIFAIALHNWMIRPHLTYLHAMERLSPVVDSVAHENEDLRKQVNISRTLVDRLSHEYAQSCAILYTSEQVLKFESDMRTLASLAHCQILSIEERKSAGRPAKPAKPGLPMIGTHEARVKMVGDYDGLIHFLKHLQKNFPGLGIHELLISGSDKPTKPLHCRFILDLHVVKDREALFDEQTAPH